MNNIEMAQHAMARTKAETGRNRQQITFNEGSGSPQAMAVFPVEKHKS